jgi:hypothetical protein
MGGRTKWKGGRKERKDGRKERMDGWMNEREGKEVGEGKEERAGTSWCQRWRVAVVQ